MKLIKGDNISIITCSARMEDLLLVAADYNILKSGIATDYHPTKLCSGFVFQQYFISTSLCSS
jgi:hypothetical protein